MRSSSSTAHTGTAGNVCTTICWCPWTRYHSDQSAVAPDKPLRPRRSVLSSFGKLSKRNCNYTGSYWPSTTAPTGYTVTTPSATHSFPLYCEHGATENVPGAWPRHARSAGRNSTLTGVRRPNRMPSSCLSQRVRAGNAARIAVPSSRRVLKDVTIYRECPTTRQPHDELTLVLSDVHVDPSSAMYAERPTTNTTTMFGLAAFVGPFEGGDLRNSDAVSVYDAFGFVFTSIDLQ